jgi:cytosine permease
MSGKKGLVIEKIAMSRVPESSRQSWYAIALIWTAVLISIPVLMVGGILTAGLTFVNIIIATAIGFGVIGLLMSLVGIISTDLGIPSAMVATKSFGDLGSRFITSIVNLVSTGGWFGVQLAACAAAFTILMQLMGVANFPVWLGAIIWGAVMITTSVTGFSFIKWLNYLTVPLLVGVVVYGAVYGGGQVPGYYLFNHTIYAPMTLPFAVSLTIGTMAAATVVCGDYSRYSKNRRDTWLASLLGVVPAAIFMIGVGAIMMISVGDPDIVMVFAGLGVPLLSIAILIIATWSTNTSNAYLGGLCVMRIGNFKEERRPIVTLLVGVLGIIVAVVGIADALVGFITVIGSIAPPITGVMIADYWIIGKGKPENWYRAKGINWIGVISWAAGAVVGFFFSFFSPALDSIIVATLLYVILYTILGKTALVPKERMALPDEENTAEEKPAEATETE